MNGTTRITRRAALRCMAGAAAGPIIVPASALGRGDNVAPSDRIAIGAVGVGNRAQLDLSNLLPQKDAQVVAICDVNSKARDTTLTLIDKHYGGSSVRSYRDFRELLQQNDIDAVMIAAPDHWHVPMIVAAAQAGKDVFSEKPMGLSIAASQAARAAIRRAGTVFQWGTQQHTQEYMEYAVKLVHSGALGELKEVRTWVPTSEWNARPAAVPKLVPVPDYLDWNMWLGPAPYTPYWENKERGWYSNSDYSHGTICNWGVHNIDICLWGLAPRGARTMEVEATGEFPREGLSDNATSWDVKFHFDHGVPVHYVSLDRMPESWPRRYKTMSDHGVAFEGNDGWIQVHRLGISAEPDSLLDGLGPRPFRRDNSGSNLFKNFLECVRSRNTPAAGIEHAVQVDIACIIADIALRMGTTLRWDIGEERFTNSEEANRLRTRVMRSPWQV